MSKVRAPRVAMIVTRDIAAESGRAKTIREIELALSQTCDVTIFRVSTFLETRRLIDVLMAMWEWLGSLISFQPLPLQCVLYGSHRLCRRIVDAISDGNFQAVYLDMVRCQVLLRILRRRLPEIHVVTDFDDLLTRRMAELVKLNQPCLVGFSGEFMPSWLRKSIEGPLSWIITRHEAATMGHSEREMLVNSNAVVVVSSNERNDLIRSHESLTRPTVHAIPPPAEIKSVALAPAAASYRFIFVGSDRLLQNRLAIDALIGFWRNLRPQTELHIFGHHERLGPRVPKVHWRGFVSDLASAYTPESILLVPARISGGVKTKVVEAWSYGCPVMGNAVAFEGLAVGDYPLMLSEDKWDALILNPASYAETWKAAAAIGNRFVQQSLSRDLYAFAWQRIMVPEFSAAESTLDPIPQNFPVTAAT